MHRIRQWLETPVSGASLAFLRASFGLVMLYQTYEFMKPTADSNVLEHLYTGQHVHWNFAFPNFEWIRPLPEPYMSVAFWTLGTASAMLALGLATPLAAIVVGVVFTYAWMMETTWWNNHYYLSSLFCLLLAVTPSGRCLSVDRWLSIRRGGNGTLADGVVPFWSVLVFRSQLFLVYIYAAVVKMNPDWLMGEPIRMWFSKRLVAEPLTDVLSSEGMDRVFAVLSSEPVVYLFVVGGLVFDLLIGFLLCLRRTKLLALVLVLLFHASNYWIFNIGAFPVMGFTATLIFLDADWPIRVWRWFQHPTFRPPDPGWMLLGMLLVPIVGAVLGWKVERSPRSHAPALPRPASWPVLAFLTIYLTIQVVLPLRHFWIPGDVHWTGEGSKFSWQVMARSHRGHIRYRLQDPSWLASDKAPYPPVEWPIVGDAKSEPLYFDVDATHVKPDDLPEIVVIFEPFVGDRIFFNPCRHSDANASEIRKRIDEIWQSHYGYSPVVLPTRSIREILEAEAEREARDSRLDRQIKLSAKALLLAYDEIQQDGPESPQRLERILDFQQSLERWIRLGEQADRNLIMKLWTCHPFDLFGADGTKWFAVFDAKLQRPASVDGNTLTLPRIDWRDWKAEKRVYTDFTLLGDTMMQFLPRLLYGYDKQGQPVAIWNAERDLVSFPFHAHLPWGIMIHQYANLRIAKFWEEQTGTRPRVYAESYSKLNQHPMQTLVDPRVDLAAAPLTLWGHNSWILPPRHRILIYHQDWKPRMKLVTTE